MSRLLFLCTIVIIFLCIGCSIDQQEKDSIPMDDEISKIHDGIPTLSYPEVGAFSVSTNGLITYCSGILVAPDVVVTAGHCNSIPGLYFTCSYLLTSMTTARYNVPSGKDIGIAILSSPIYSVEPAVIRSHPVTTGKDVLIVGYGSDPHDTLPIPGTKQLGWCNILSTGDVLELDASNAGHVACTGDSGGGVFDSDLLIGIMTQSNHEDITVAINLSEPNIRDEINALMYQAYTDGYRTYSNYVNWKILKTRCNHEYGPWRYYTSCVKCRECSICGYTQCDTSECITQAPTPVPTQTPACNHSFGSWSYVTSCVKCRTCVKCGYMQCDSSGCR